MGDAGGAHTVSLMRAARFAKDNRLLPRGFGSGSSLPEGIDFASIAPVGVDGDSSFVPGGDVVRYRADVSGRRGPFTVDVQALYQPFKPSHTQALDAEDSAEEARFLDLLQRHSAPVQAAAACSRIP